MKWPAGTQVIFFMMDTSCPVRRSAYPISTGVRAAIRLPGSVPPAWNRILLSMFKLSGHQERRFTEIARKVEGMIRSHMWPISPMRIPKSREAWILCIADKRCSLVETFGLRDKGGVES